MKKLNFFPVLFMALCMFLGFDVSAQYKSLNESKALVENTVKQKSQNTIAGELKVGMVMSLKEPFRSSTPNAVDVYIIRYGNVLLEQLKSVSDVATAINNTDLIFSSQGGGSQRITARQNAAAYFKQLLSI